MATDYQNLEESQKILCRQYKAEFSAADPGLMLGIAKDIKDKRPINGLRHPITETTTGWYIWGGEQEMSHDPNYFEPMHASHVVELYPEIAVYLGLVPGWRFLINPDVEYEDVWQDETLLNVES